MAKDKGSYGIGTTVRNVAGNLGQIVRVQPPECRDDPRRREYVVRTEGGNYEYWPHDWCSPV